MTGRILRYILDKAKKAHEVRGDSYRSYTLDIEGNPFEKGFL